MPPFCCGNSSIAVKNNVQALTRAILSPIPLLEDFSGPHTACLGGRKYPGSTIDRFPLTKEQVPWAVPLQGYNPVEYTAAVVLQKPVWADDEASIKKIKFNRDTKGVNRASFTGTYQIDKKTRRPLNPIGRTGISGRGLLGRFGPNFAADPIVTRWKRDGKNDFILDKDGNKILQFVAITRKDNGSRALPGGMVEAGETVSATLRREFGEEALNSLALDDKAREDLQHNLDDCFSNGVLIFQGYVDDPRNTDNAWMETTAMLFHDMYGDLFSRFNFTAGDDAAAVEWLDVTEDLDLYASHLSFMQTVYRYLTGRELNLS